MARTPKPRRLIRFLPTVEVLESRWVAHAGHGQGQLLVASLPGGGGAPPVPLPPGGLGHTHPPVVPRAPEVPAFQSNPGAAAKLYLDFNSHHEDSWGDFTNIDASAFDIDGDQTTFSAIELNYIESIWRFVAEDYAPFDIDVTTVIPDAFDNGVALRVVIGGDGFWTGGANGGISYMDAFTSDIPNVVWVFPDHLDRGNPRLVGESISHEAGHAFGLHHQSLYDDDGDKIEEYNPGNVLRAPIMGDSYAAERGVWWTGPSSEGGIQDDVAVLAALLGWRSDEVADDLDEAAPLILSGAAVAGASIIGQLDDVDVWSFTTDEGAIALHVMVPGDAHNLAARAQLVDDQGNVIVDWQEASANPSVTLSATVEAGSYRLLVGSHGACGDLGAYTISGVIVPKGTVVSPPEDLAVSTVAYHHLDLAWNDVADDEIGYEVESSMDGATYYLVASLPADSSSFSAYGLNAATSYHYRVKAISALTSSEYSNEIVATTLTPPPSAPTGLKVLLQGKKLVLAWNDVSSDELMFQVQRSSDGVTWTPVGAASANTSTFGIPKPTKRQRTQVYRVVALNTGGESAASNTVAVTYRTILSRVRSVGGFSQLFSFYDQLFRKKSR
jgi:hypothetical protein